MLLTVLVPIRRDLWIYGVLPLVHLLFDLQGLWADQLFWPFLGADLGNVQIPGGLGDAAGQPYADRVGDRIEDIFGTYGGASLWSHLIDAGGVVALVLVAYGAKLYRRSRLERLVLAGRI